MERRIGIQITLCKQYIGRMLERLLADNGIGEFNGPQGRILHVLWGGDGISLQELANGTGLANTTLTSMIDRMEGLGLVRRLPAPGDRRKTLIALTEKARSLRDAYEAVSARATEIIYQGFSEEEASHLEELLERVLVNLRNAETRNFQRKSSEGEHDNV
jgi:DNA-binding MarR family transcriptional regulator